MARVLRAALIAVATLTLAGCATSVPSVDLNRSQAGPIRTMALLRVAESQHFTVRYLAGIPVYGGRTLITPDTPSTQAFVDEYNRRNIRLSTVMVEELQRLLKKTRVDVTYLPDEVPKLKDGVDDYSHLSTGTDAILNVWFGPMGYLGEGMVDTPNYGPWIVVHARLLHGKTKQQLYQKTFTAGYHAKIKNAVAVSCGLQYRFPTFRYLIADVPYATRGLVDCQQAIAARIADDLKPGPEQFARFTPESRTRR
jgi:hypothetical protein